MTGNFAAAPIGAVSSNASKGSKSSQLCSNFVTIKAMKSNSPRLTRETRLSACNRLHLTNTTFLSGATKATGKITLPAPSTMHFYRCTDFADSAVYSNIAAFFADLAEVFKQEIGDLAQAGCRYIQLDEVAIALLCDPAIRDQIASVGNAPDTLVDLYIDSINQAVAGRPTDVVIGVHMCRGNFKGHYLGAGGYELVAERFFANTKVNHFLLEYDTRAGRRFRAAAVCAEKPRRGARSHQLEDTGARESRCAETPVEEATQYIDLDRLAISPQCGFASTVAGNPLTEADERAKLALIVEAAKAIWS